MKAAEGLYYPWKDKSTDICNPCYFRGRATELPPAHDIQGPHFLLKPRDLIITGHISSTGNIAGNSPAAKCLSSRGVTAKDLNLYGTRRGKNEIMLRGTFANIELVKTVMNNPGAQTRKFPLEKNSTYLMRVSGIKTKEFH